MTRERGNLRGHGARARKSAQLVVAHGLLALAPMSVRRASLLVLLTAACGTAPSGPDAGVDAVGLDAAPRGQGSEAQGDLIINELAPRGAGSDWAELVNRSGAVLDLCGYFLTDSPDRLDHYLPLGGVLPPAPCPPRPLDPDAYLVITLDGTPIVDGQAIDPAHAPFKLDLADELYVVSTSGATIDGLLFLYPPGPTAPATTTLARVPDRAGLFFERAPSPGAANPELAP